MLRIADRYSVTEAFVYGSGARGDHKPDSDIDVAVILEGERGDRYKVSGDMAGIAFDVLLETGVLVSAFPIWKRSIGSPNDLAIPP